MVTSPSPDKVIIGRAEPLFLVGLLNQNVPAKIDSGAYRSAIHAQNIVVKNGQLSCDLLLGHPSYQGDSVAYTTTDFAKVGVVNSFGLREERYEIKLQVKLADQTFKTSFTLANRSKNIFPVLIGRTFLNKRFIIDTSKTSISRVELKKLQHSFPNQEKEELAWISQSYLKVLVITQLSV